MTLQQLRYIVTIVNCGSISEAAKQLFITQPSLSNSVRELEKEMGISIFNRSSKGIALSSQGMEFLSYARQVLEQAELLEQHYTNKKPVKRICSISTQHYAFAVNAFANLVSCQNTDEYEFTLRETRTYEIIDDVKNYRVSWASSTSMILTGRCWKSCSRKAVFYSIRCLRPAPMYSSA